MPAESVFEEADLTIPNGQRRHFREALEPVRDRAGKIIGLIGAATDITEQKDAQLQLSEALTFRERMMGILGHDLRNPLSTIIVTAGLLLQRNDLAPDARDQLLRGRRAAERMREMIDTLLDFTLARFLGKVPVTPVPADLSQVATAVADEIRLAWPDRAVDVDVRGDPHGEWDPARLSQVISNLVGNAIGYGDPQLPVRVLVDGTEDDVLLKVSNDGPPIPPDMIHVLFEPFRRGVAADRSPGGLGLGLYIVQQIVQAHGGRITVESGAKMGTTFTVRLPRHPNSPPVQEHAA
jgi:signal transduction histidine kinase